MGNVFKALFTPVGLGGLGIDFTKSRPFEDTPLVPHKPSLKETPTYDEESEKNKIADQEATANKKRIMAETETTKTSALGNVGTTTTQKKTLLGG